MSIKENYLSLVNDVEAMKAKRGIDYPIKIVVVTKTRTAAEIKEVIDAGANYIGENRVQEAESKFPELNGLSVEKHMIGHLQSNKANKAIELFDVIESVDSFKLAEKLSKRLQDLEREMKILLEVKTSYEDSKEGITPDNASELLGRILELPALKVKGLMTIAPFVDDEKIVRGAFSKLFQLKEKLSVEYRDCDLVELSMGMTDDYQWAIEEGSTLIRPGRLIFGARNYG